MKINNLYTKVVLFTILSLTCFYGNSQKLLQSRKSSFYTYIYKISDNEAKKIYKSKNARVDSSYFHSLVDSFATDKGFQGKLTQGHYLKTYASEENQISEVTSVHNFDVFILNNNTDLCVQLYDLQGNIISTAELEIGCKRLNYNQKCQYYLDKKSNKKGFLTISYKGFTAYYNLDRQYNNSCIKRVTQKVVFGTPLKYAWIPVATILYLPKDIVKTISHGYSYGSIYQLRIFVSRVVEKVKCLFDDYYCNDYSNYRAGNENPGYLVFNKPKYMPGDTVKFKAFIVNKKGKAIKGKVQVELQTTKKNIDLSTLDPYCKGGYAYEFKLHDSLQLHLDRFYRLTLSKNSSHEYISGTFKYEDYELSKNKLTLRLDQSKQYRHQLFKIFATGTDENDLNLLDARLELLITPLSTKNYCDNQVFIPDTIMFLKRCLNPTEETEILIPDSLFPKANFEYLLRVKLLSSNNELITELRTVEFYHELKAIDIELLQDSIQVQYLNNNIVTEKIVTIEAVDNFGNATMIFQGASPCKIAVNPFFSSYRVLSDGLSKSLEISSQSALIRCFSQRSSDSIFIESDNPRNIPFNYNIYRKNCQVLAGYGTGLNIHKKSSSKQIYFVALRYLWGGRIVEENYSIPLMEKRLNISVNQPKIVYPGQKTQIELLVTDIAGKPVKGVDLTAYAMTSKFNTPLPELQEKERKRKGKRLINNFHFNKTQAQLRMSLNLNYTLWKSLAGLDSIEYYKFIYPQKAPYRFEYATSDHTTQFAPFVVANGVIQAIHVIYLDDKPIYFSWSSNQQNYAFKADAGFHQIILRTSNRSITLDSLYLEPGKKLIFSLNENLKLKNVKSIKLQPELSNQEQWWLYRYIFPYRNNFGERFAYIEQDDQIQPLNYYAKNGTTNCFAGPVVGDVKFQLLDSFSSIFIHEPFFEYDFAPKLLKMRSVDKSNYPRSLVNEHNRKNLSDSVLTKKAFYDQWQFYKDAKRKQNPKYAYPSSTQQGNGRLEIRLSNKEEKYLKQYPLNLLIFKEDDDDFLRIYPGKSTVMEDLQQGYYKLVLVYSGDKYQIHDSIFIKPNGLNYCNLKQDEILKKDNYSIYISNIIEKHLFEPVNSTRFGAIEQIQSYTKYKQLNYNLFSGNGRTISGTVYDKESGEPMPGVTVELLNTTFGTVTNIDGHYSISTPFDNNSELSFSFIGCVTEVIPILNDQFIDVNLVPDVLELNEVIVVGYGVMKKSFTTGSIATVKPSNTMRSIDAINSGTLQGRAAGVSISANNNLQTANGITIQIRGTASVFNKTPLYIINGMVFTGNIAELDTKLIDKIEILRDAAATAIYGEKGANGVVIITTLPGAFHPMAQKNNKGAQFGDDFLQSTSQSSIIRKNFSDYAFWQPKLVTDKEGKAQFTATFPDDVTNWKTYYLAMNSKKQAGTAQSSINSYKPLMAQLSIPRFLVQGDTSFVIGKALNYTNDSLSVTTKFEVNGQNNFSKTDYCINALIDSLPVVAGQDSISVKYFLQREGGYFDGELKNIPVFPQGMEQTKGDFFVLDHDTTLNLSFDPKLGQVNIHAEADIMEVIADEITHISNYKYFCNEQLSSKLKALLAREHINKVNGEKFEDQKAVSKLIDQIMKNQKENGLWGWWKDSAQSEWISLYVLETLTQAEKMGYQCSIDKGAIAKRLVWDLEINKDLDARIRILKTLKALNSSVNDSAYITDMEKNRKITFNEYLQLTELKQQCKLKYQLDTLKKYQKTTLFGNIYYANPKQVSTLLSNDIQNTLIAYKILRMDTTRNHTETLRKMRNYFFETRTSGHWCNTYQSAQIIETILPDILKGDEKGIKKITKPSLTFHGALTQTVTEFPFSMTVTPDQKLQITKLGDYPVYFTNYQKFWNNNPIAKSGDFIVNSTFSEKQDSILSAGKVTTLTVKVNVLKDAQYVMINIPIPAGCSYTDKRTYFANEVHRESFKNETSIFCQNMTMGTYTFEINLTPKYTGTYTLNPAKVELMYFPTFNGNNAVKKIKIIR